MRSNSIRGIAGNVKLRGKLCKVLSCGCCDVYNFKPAYRWKQAGNEIRAYQARQT